MKIALVKDRLGFWELYQPIFENRGHDVRLIEFHRQADFVGLMQQTPDAFVWRAKHNPSIKTMAQRCISAFHDAGIPTLPDWHSYWHYDDKISQHLLFQTHQIPTPPTFVFTDEAEALQFAAAASYPLIYKSAYGAGSLNVGLLQNPAQAKKYIKRAFGRGLKTSFRHQIQRKYVYLQTFLPDNQGDYRLLCYGNDVVSGFFRQNRKDVPLASGSGKSVVDELPEALLDFIHAVHTKLNFLFMAYDVMQDAEKNWVITEISVVHGDLHSEDLWQRTPYYRRTAIGWERFQPKGSRHEMLLDLYLDAWTHKTGDGR